MLEGDAAMQTIHIHRRLESETVPELIPFVGKSVEIIVREEPAASPLPSGVTPGTGDWDAFQKAADALRETYDFDAVESQNVCDLQHRG